MVPGAAAAAAQHGNLVAQMNASYGGSRGAPGQMTLGRNDNGPAGNDLYIINPTSPKNLASPMYNYNTYATSPRTPAAMGGPGGHAGAFARGGLSVDSPGAQMAVGETRQRSNDSRQSQVCRRVIEDFASMGLQASKYSAIDRRSGSIGPRRQNPIVKQQ